MDREDRYLIQKARSGDLESLEKLLKKHSPQIQSIAKYVCLNAPSEADDVHQQTMLTIFKNIKKFKCDSNFSTWFYRIAANHCWMKFRKHKREKLISIDDVKDLKQHEQETNKGIYTDFYNILSKLPLNYRMAITTVDIEGLSLKEAAKILNISVGALKSRLLRARRMFKKLIEEMDLSY